MSRIKAVILICLKLDADTIIPDDMPLMDGEHDIDSLDVLFIVTELEREFDVEIADGAIQPTDLTTIGSLCLFIDCLGEAAYTGSE